MAELHEIDATAQAELVASREVSSRELIDHAIDRVETLNPVINAVIWTNFEQARADAARRDDAAVTNGGSSAVDVAFPGVPFLLKDIGATQAGLPLWSGNRAMKDADHRRLTDTELGRRFRDAGLVTIGKTNLPELGTSPTTQPLSCGPTANPWDTDRSPSGSSGGAAAAVASGMVAMAHANDGGGSTRLPAAWCGLVGLKPSRGRIPNPEDVSRSTSELVVTKSVRDTARLLDAVHGATDADLYQLGPPASRFVDSLEMAVPELSVAVMTDGGLWPVDPECVAAVEQCGRQLEAMGHHVKPVGSEVILGPESSVNGRVWMSGVGYKIETLGRRLGRALDEHEVEPYNWTAAQHSRSQTATTMAGLLDEQQRWAGAVTTWMSDFDLLLTPTAGAVPMRTDDLRPPDDKPWTIRTVYGRIGAFTIPFNVTGHPAISLPLHWTDQGLPVGVQLVAGMGREDLLLSVAARLEEQQPWFDRYRSITVRPPNDRAAGSPS